MKVSSKVLSNSACMQELTDEQRVVRFANVGDPRRRDRFRSTFDEGVASPYVFHGIAAYEKAFKNMELDLADDRSWLMGEQFTLADINLIPLVARLDYLGLLDIWIADRPNVQSWWDRATERPSFAGGITNHFKPGEVIEMANYGQKINDQVVRSRQAYLEEFPPKN